MHFFFLMCIRKQELQQLNTLMCVVRSQLNCSVQPWAIFSKADEGWGGGDQKPLLRRPITMFIRMCLTMLITALATPVPVFWPIETNIQIPEPICRCISMETSLPHKPSIFFPFILDGQSTKDSHQADGEVNQGNGISLRLLQKTIERDMKRHFRDDFSHEFPWGTTLGDVQTIVVT